MVVSPIMQEQSVGGSLAKYYRLGRAGMSAPMVKVNLILPFTWPSDNTVFCLGLKTDVCPSSLALIIIL